MDIQPRSPDVGTSASAREVTVLAFPRLEERHIAQIRAVDPRVRVAIAPDKAAAIQLAPTAQIMLGWNMSREVIDVASHLRWIQSTGAGVDRLIATGVLDREIILTNSSGIHHGLVEHVLAVLLALNRRLHLAIRNQIRHTWDRSSRMRSAEIASQTLGILGLGHIGSELAIKAHALGMRVIGTKRTPEAVAAVERVFPPEGLLEVMGAADAVVIALPLTKATRGLIGPAQLRAMKPTAFLINIGRGAIVQEAALLEVLQEKRIGGAALDVFEQEPLPAESAFYDLEDVIVTPHLAGESPHYMDRAVSLFAKNLDAYLHGRPLENVVDRDRGY